MIPEADDKRRGAISNKSSSPLDVRIIGSLFYIGGVLTVLRGMLLCSGRLEPQESYSVLLGAIVLASGLTQGINWLLVGFCYLLCAWGLMRSIGCAWWFAMVFSVYYLFDRLLVFPDYPVAITIAIAGHISTIAWLWFRRELYGICPKKRDRTVD